MSALLRLVLWKVFGPTGEVGWVALPAILLVGFFNDLVVLVFLNLPASIYLGVMPDRLARSRRHQRLFAFIVYLSLFGLIYLAQVEFFFFDEFNARFNLVAVDYLIYPREVLINIWESYPILRFLLIDGILAMLLTCKLWPQIRSAFSKPCSRRRRMVVIACHLTLLLPALWFSTDSLDFSTNRVTKELTHNGISSLFKAFHTNQLNYDVYYRTLPKEQAFVLTRTQLKGDGKFVDDKLDNLNRRHPGRGDGLGLLNVVVVVEESLSGSFTGLFGNPDRLTPNIDRLARKSLFFTRAYASGTRTVRGLEAISCSFPPIPSEAIVKRPGSENIANWGKVMKQHGYQVSFLYGGYGTFDNMNHFFSSNGFAISDRTDIPNPSFANIWGVADGDLFNHALDYFDQQAKKNKPFFSIIMSTSNHRPYTFPNGIPGIPAKGGGRGAGVRYADYALGHFLQKAKNHSWFDNTLFVIVADHCARLRGRADVPIANYHIPLLFYAPKHLEAGQVDAPIGQIDIAPTVLGLLGLDYTAPFYGIDVLHQQGDLLQQHPLLLNHNHDVAMLVDDRMVVLGLHKTAALYQYDWVTNTQRKLADDPQLFDLAAAIYQSAYELFTFRHYR
ncbi:LTA synthase family protein [Geothermobacter ehrlichii]|uniref:LTA synthase family protein n=1 Tax=Geothermobacter ehrlichii TaxID=213224 RepID=UPI0016532EC4|nr:alkaline phosphatase family protein [Geothermobacter ehrlichii]